MKRGWFARAWTQTAGPQKSWFIVRLSTVALSLLSAVHPKNEDYSTAAHRQSYSNSSLPLILLPFEAWNTL